MSDMLGRIIVAVAMAAVGLSSAAGSQPRKVKLALGEERVIVRGIRPEEHTLP